MNAARAVVVPDPPFAMATTPVTLLAVPVVFWLSAGTSAALIVPQDGVTLAAADIEAHCRRLLAVYKVPKIIEFRSELPKSGVGKVLRRKLKEAGAGPAGSP